MDTYEEKVYTIGEIAKLTNLSIQTLRYYDKINLFKPAFIDKLTNYRYYTDSQIYHLDLIKALKYIGTPLEDIKLAQSLTSEQLLQFLSKQEKIVEEKIKRMLEVQSIVTKTKNQLEEQLNVPVFHEVYEADSNAQRLLAVKTNDLSIMDNQNAYFISLTQFVEQEGSIMNMRYGGIYPLLDYGSVEGIKYEYLFTPLLTNKFIEHLNSDINILRMPAGRYACVAFLFDTETYFREYKRLYEYTIKHQLTPQSNVFEIFMPTNYSPDQSPEFIVELKVKIN